MGGAPVIVPSIDIMNGRAVQLRQGRELVLDGGDPRERLDAFGVAGEVAVIDLDAALGRGDNTNLIREMVRRAPCRVGGGIRDADAARQWLDAGARSVIIGTAATPALCGALPKERVIAAVDAERGELVVDGWRQRTGRGVLAAVRELAPHAGGLLLTQTEHEGLMGGFDWELLDQALAIAGTSRITAAGGITTAEEIAALDRRGADAQVGMALYTDALALGDAIAAPLLRRPEPWPTVVCDDSGVALGLAWSTAASLRSAVSQRRGIYWSRARDALWVKGATSGATQELVAVALDCDRDALRFTVRQHGAGFCHRETRTCWGDRFDLASLERIIRRRSGSGDRDSGTVRLLNDPALLRAKLLEEAAELASAEPRDAVHEAADLLYFALAALQRSGAALADVQAELERRSLRVTRRPMAAR